MRSPARGGWKLHTFVQRQGARAERLSEVAAATGLTRAGARRILLTLQTLGYVRSDGKYHALTPRILDLGFAYLSSTPLWESGRIAMGGALGGRVKESCSAAVLEGLDVVYVAARAHAQDHEYQSGRGLATALPSGHPWAGAAGAAPDELRALMAWREQRAFTLHADRRRRAACRRSPAASSGLALLNPGAGRA